MKQKITLKWETVMPAGTPPFSGMQDIAKKINERTNDQVTVECYGANTLVPETEILEAVGSGKLDIGFTQSGYYGKGKSGIIPRSEAGQLPIWPSGQAGCAFVKAVLDKYIRNDMATVGVVPIIYQINCCDDFGHFFSPYYAHIWCKQTYSSIEDLVGARIFVQHEVTGAILSELGMVPKSMAFNDTYAALANNEIDGVLMSNVTPIILNLPELINCCVKIDYPQCEDNFTIMNKKTYDSLSADIRNIIIEELKNWETAPANDRAPLTKWGWDVWNEREKAGSVKIIELPPSEKARCKQVWEQKSVDAWVKHQIAAGFKDAKSYMDDLLKIRDETLASGLPQYTGYIA